ncbi:nadp:d-xylose dehydrogenase [Fusarium coicis]|nr:nadp:d-xylose dehydrogenase [Fusarium coicis]
MSFGVGVGDVVVTGKGIWKVSTLLHGEAVDEFGRFERIHRNLEELSRFIASSSYGPQHKKLFRRESRKINRLLIEFHEKIRELRPFLGRHRERNIRGCLQKIKWPLHSKKLEQIRQDLLSQLNYITMKQQSFPNSASRPFMENLFMRNSIDLEDPFGVFHRFDFFSASSWEALHQILLQTFPLGHHGHEIIQNHRYLLHRSQSFSEILCNSPGIKPIQDVIKCRELVLMSAIFPNLGSHDTECPACHRERVANFHGQALEWRCGLWLRFHDSYNGQPDPLTQIALNNIKSSGRAAFTFRFLGPADQAKTIRELIRDRITQIGPVPQSQSRARTPKIRHFRRVTLCTSQWPEFSHNRAREVAKNRLRRTTQGLQRTKQVLASEDLPFAKAAALVNTRFWHGRRDQALSRFVTSALQALTNSVPLAVWSQDDKRLLDDVGSGVEAGTFGFVTEYLEARCFLWIFWEVLQLEAKIISSCAKLLDTWTCPDNLTRQKTPLTFKIFSFPHIALLVPWRLTFDLVDDIVEWFGERRPLYLPTAIQQLIMRSGTISL